jgi:hypothetical protein
MSTELTVSLISAAVALGSAVLAALLSARAAKAQVELQAEIDRQQAVRRRKEDRQDLMNRIRDPVLWSAFDLQSRIFNIVAQEFLAVYLIRGSAEQRAYAQRNTLFLFAQYLAWVEIVRCSVQFLELGDKQENREVVNCFSKISSVLNSDGFPDCLFCIFRGDQRAIGEIMIDTAADGELGCLGYAEFCARIDTDPSFAQWLARLSTHIEQLAEADTSHPRLVALQHNLIDLINLLDPESIRFPDWYRSKLEPGLVG